MGSPDERPFTKGDPVKWWSGGLYGNLYGTVRKVTENAVTVDPASGGKPVVFPRRRYGTPFKCEHVSPQEAATAKWKAEQPACSLVQVTSFQGRLEVDFNGALDGATLETLKSEITALWGWFQRKPEQTP